MSDEVSGEHEIVEKLKEEYPASHALKEAGNVAGIPGVLIEEGHAPIPVVVKHSRIQQMWTALIAVTLTFALAIGSLVYSMTVIANDKQDTQDSLKCVRGSTGEFYEAVGNSIKLLVDLNVPITEALIELAADNPAGIREALEGAQATIDGTDGTPGEEAVRMAIDEAVAAYDAAVLAC